MNRNIKALAITLSDDNSFQIEYIEYKITVKIRFEVNLMKTLSSFCISLILKTNIAT